MGQPINRKQWFGIAMIICVALLVVIVGVSGKSPIVISLIALFLAWLTSPLWIGWWAYKRGKSPWMWGSLALIVTPIIPAIILYLSMQRYESVGIKKRQLRLMTEDSVQHLMAKYERTQTARDLEDLNLALREYELRYGRLPEVYLVSVRKAVEELTEEYKKTHDEKLVVEVQNLREIAATGRRPAPR